VQFHAPHGNLEAHMGSASSCNSVGC